MHTAQSGIFALGTPSHAYLEFDLAPGRSGRELVDKISSLREPRTTMGGVNLGRTAALASHRQFVTKERSGTKL